MPENSAARGPRDGVLLLWIFLGALTLRMIYLVQLQGYPFFDYPLLDFTFFDQRAREILTGKLFSVDYLFNPLYSYYLAVIYKIFGFSLYFPRFVQTIIGACSTILIFYLGKLLWSRPVGIIAAVITALYIPLVYYDGILMATTLILFFILAALNIIVFTGNTGAAPKHFAAGILLGLAVLGRPNFLLIPVFIFPWYLWNSRSLKKSILNYAVCVVGIIVMISHISIYHKMIKDEWIIVAPHGGINFYIGNHPEATGAYMSIPGISDAPGQQVSDSIRMAEEDLGHAVSAAEVSGYWMAKSMGFLETDPLGFTGLFVRKIALFFNHVEIPSEYGLDFDRQYLSVLRWPLFTFSVIAPFSILGLIIGVTRWRRNLLLYLVFLAVMLSVVLFFVHARYRLQGVPFLILFASGALHWLWTMIKTSQWRLLAGGILVLLAAVGLTRLDLVEQNFLPGHYNLARSYHRAGDPQKALEQLEIILAQSESVKVREFMGKIYLETGRFQEAITQFKIAVQQDPALYSGILNLGICHFRIGAFNDAEKYFQRAAAMDASRFEGFLNLGMVYLQEEKYSEANACFKKMLLSDVPVDVRQQVLSIIRQLEREVSPADQNEKEQGVGSDSIRG